MKLARLGMFFTMVLAASPVVAAQATKPVRGQPVASLYHAKQLLSPELRPKPLHQDRFISLNRSEYGAAFRPLRGAAKQQAPAEPSMRLEEKPNTGMTSEQAQHIISIFAANQ